MVGESDKTILPRGKSKSGRVWRDVRTQRYSSMIQDKFTKVPFKKRMLLKQERKRLQNIDKEMKESKANEKRKKREETEVKKKRKLENEKKNEVVVAIKNPAKLKKMKKKQLRYIEKR